MNIENITLGATAAELVSKINEIIAAVNDIRPATSYEELEDKPTINGVTLSGNKSTGQLLIALSGATDYASLLSTLATKQYADGASAAAVSAAETAVEAALSGKLDADISKIEEGNYVADGGYLLVYAGGKFLKMPLKDLAAYTAIKTEGAKYSIGKGISSQRQHIALSGEQNGSNTAYSTETGFVLGTTQLFLNGQLMTEGWDYTEESSYQITMLTHVPLATDAIVLMAIPLIKGQ